MSIPMMDDYKFQQPEESPNVSYWGQDCPRCPDCRRPIDEDEGCLDVDCAVERLIAVPPSCILCRAADATTGLNGQYCEDCWPERNKTTVGAILTQGER